MDLWTSTNQDQWPDFPALTMTSGNGTATGDWPKAPALANPRRIGLSQKHTRGRTIAAFGRDQGMKMKQMLFRAVLLASLAALPAPAVAQAQDPAQWSGLHYRQVGPWRGGRVTAVTGVPSQPDVFYMGTTGGGVWKSTDSGNSWTNTSDGQISVASMGAVAVADSNANIVYAGSGSSKIRSNVSIGRGIWKSVDGAKTWAFIGLRDVGQISTIRINPANPDEVFVASTGNPFAMARIAASIAPATAARRGPRYFSSTRRWAQPIWSWRPTIRKPFMPPCGTASAGRGPSPPAARMAASTSLSMAATRGPSWRAVCQTACSGAPISACPPRRRTGSMP